MSEEAQAAPAPAPTAEADGAIVCPFCGDNVPTLRAIEPGMRLRLQQNAEIDSIPDAVCDGCFKQMGKNISKGAALRAEQIAKEQNRLMLWKNRVQLIKQAKLYLSQKNYSDAAVSYEKYIRVIEIVYDLQAGELSPDLFKNQGRSQEMTLIASVYWDLMRIYDTHPSYRDRQSKAAEKLAEFVRYTPIFGHIMRRAENEIRKAKNPEAFKKFLRLSNAKRPRCFIATAAFDDYTHPVVIDLCRFREERLKKFACGRLLIHLYYRHSPAIAHFLDKHPALKPATRMVLTWFTNRKFIRKGLSARAPVSHPTAHGAKQSSEIR